MNAETGTFVWFDFATKDETKAMNFYKTIFGWKFDKMGDAFWMIKAGDKTIGGLRRETARDFRPAAGMMAYFSVPSIKEASSLVKQAGGVLVGDSVNIGEHGYFQLFQDLEANQMSLWSLKP
ncbi:MAG: VOC family protein [Bdellovibrionota bacterium]